MPPRSAISMSRYEPPHKTDMAANAAHPVLLMARDQATSILVIFRERSPRGVTILTSSPRLRPSSALPTGASLESFNPEGFASAEPTIVYLFDFPAASLTWTIEPTRTSSLQSSEESTTEGDRRLCLSES